jgi:hypothetical protein
MFTQLYVDAQLWFGDFLVLLHHVKNKAGRNSIFKS